VRARSEATRDVHSGLLSMLGSKTTLAVVRELSCGILGGGEGGLKGIGVSGSGYNEVLALRMLNVVDYVEQGRCAKLQVSASAPHPVIVALSFQACLRACMRTSTCACVWTCMHTYAQKYVCIYFCVYVCMCICVHAHVDVCMHSCKRILFICTCFWRGRLCFRRGRDRGFVLYISLFLRVLGWGVCVCLYTRVHTHKLLGYLM